MPTADRRAFAGRGDRRVPAADAQPARAADPQQRAPTRSPTSARRATRASATGAPPMCPVIGHGAQFPVRAGAAGAVIVHWDDDDWHGPTRTRGAGRRAASRPRRHCGLGARAIPRRRRRRGVGLCLGSRGAVGLRRKLRLYPRVLGAAPVRAESTSARTTTSSSNNPGRVFAVRDAATGSWRASTPATPRSNEPTARTGIRAISRRAGAGWARAIGRGSGTETGSSQKGAIAPSSPHRPGSRCPSSAPPRRSRSTRRVRPSARAWRTASTAASRPEVDRRLPRR